MLPPQDVMDIPTGKRDDWESISSDSILVSQRLLRAYQQKRQNYRRELKLSRNPKHKKDNNDALKTEHVGYRRQVLG